MWFPAGRQPIPPPLRQKFAVIEKQREEEAALGELPLEQVLAPVPVPEVSLDLKLLPWQTMNEDKRVTHVMVLLSDQLLAGC